MAKGFRVRLDDGSEMDLDSDMVRSWYDQGLIRNDTPMRAPGSRNWKRMDEIVEMRGWGRSGAEAEEEEAPAGPGTQKWRSYAAAVLMFAAAAGAGYLWFFPAQWTSALAPTPWKEIALGALALGLALVTGWPIGRIFARIVMLLAAFALFPLAGVLIAQGVRGLPLLVLISAWILASGFFAFLAAIVATSSAIVFLLTILLGAAGVVYFGYVPPGSAPAPVQQAAPPPTTLPHAVPAAASPSAVSPASAPAVALPTSALPASAAPSAAPPAGQAAAVQAAAQEVPMLTPRAAELLMSRSAAQILDPPEAFRRAYGLLGRGLHALSAAESKDLGELHTQIYASLPAAERDKLGDYIDRARNRYATTPDEDRQMSQVMKRVVLSLPADRRSRLQALVEKAMTAGLELERTR